MKRRAVFHLAAAVAVAGLTMAVATSTRSRRAPRHQARWVQAGPLELRYVRAGRGPVVVLVHGFGESLLAWRGVFDQLAAANDVIALDLPGFGLSSKPKDGYATPYLAHDLLAALHALGVARAVLVGHSLGGAVVAAAAVSDTALARAVVLIDPALTASHGPIAEGPAVTEYEALRTRVTSPHDPDWLKEPDSALAYLPADDSAYRVALAAVLQQFDFGWLNPARAAALRMPILVLWGQYDPLFPLAQGRALARSLPNARFEVIARSWHRPHEERPDETAAAITRFLASTTP